MSFILDALRKSEHDRQRAEGARAGRGGGVAAEAEEKRLGDRGRRLARRQPGRGRRAAAAARRSAFERHRDTTRLTTRPANASCDGSRHRTLDAPQPTRDPPVAAATGAAPTNPRPIPGTVPPVLQPALPADEAGGTHNPLTDELSEGAAGDDNYDAGYDSGYPAEGSPYPTAPPGVNGPPGDDPARAVPSSTKTCPRPTPSRARRTRPRMRRSRPLRTPTATRGTDPHCQRSMSWAVRPVCPSCTSTCTSIRPSPRNGSCSSTRGATRKATRCRKARASTASRRTAPS